MIHNENLLVTGGGGLIGSTIPAPFKPSREELDLMDSESIMDYLSSNKIKSIIHCAGKVGGVKANKTKLGEFFYENIIINTNVLEAARRCGVKKVVSFMSTCVFPDKVSYPIKEEYIHQGEPHSTNYAYAYAKRMVDVQSRAYREQYGCNYVTIIPCNVYGPNDYYNLDDSHVIPALIHKCHEACAYQQTFEVWGNGEPLREFLYSEDAGKIAMMSLESYDDEHPMIISPGVEHSISEVVDIIVDILGYPANIEYMDEELKGQYRKPSDNTKFKLHYPDFKFTPIREGLEKSINWFCENYIKGTIRL